MQPNSIRRRDLLVGLAALGGMALLLTGGGFLPDRIFHYGDWTTYYIPLRTHLVEAWRAGDLLPLWWPSLLGGFPIGANPQYGLFYPPHWLLLVMPLGFGLSLITWAHLVWGGLGVWALLRGRGAEMLPAVLGGIIYLAAGPMLSATSTVNLSLALAWLPWVLHWFPLGVKAGSRWARRGAAAALAAMFLVGGLEILMWSVLLLPFWVYASSRIYLDQGPEFGNSTALKSRIGPVVRGLIVIGIAALALAAVQMLPSLELIGQSTRMEGIDPREASRFAAVFGRWTGLLLPRLTWNPNTLTSWVSLTGDMRAHFLPSLYLGMAALMLAILGWRRAPRGDRGVMAWTGGLGVLLGLGPNLPLIGTLAGLIPGGAFYRFQEKYLFLTVLAVAYLAGWGLQALKEKRRNRLLTAAGLAGMAGAVLLWVLGPSAVSFLIRWSGQHLTQYGATMLPSYHTAQVTSLAATAGVCLAAGLLFGPAGRRRMKTSAAAAWVTVLVGLELATAGYGFFRTTSLAELRTPGGAASVILEEGRAARAIRWMLIDDEAAPYVLFADPDRQLELYRRWIVPNLGPLQALPTFDGASALRLRPQARAEASWRLASESTRIPLGGALGIRYLLLTDMDTAARIQSLPAVEALYPTSTHPVDAATTVPPLLVLENRAALQPLQLVFDWLTATDDEEAFERLCTSGLVPNRQVVISPAPPGVDPEAILLPTPPDRGLPDPEPEWRIAVIDRSSDHVQLCVTTAAPALLVRCEYPYRGWRATVSGEQVKIHAANVVHQAVEVGAGTSEVTFAFRPRIFFWGGILSLLGLIWFLFPLRHWIPISRDRITILRNRNLISRNRI